MRASLGKARKWMVRGQGAAWAGGRAARSCRVASGTWLFFIEERERVSVRVVAVVWEEGVFLRAALFYPPPSFLSSASHLLNGTPPQSNQGASSPGTR
jgi:hypothetical protein